MDNELVASEAQTTNKEEKITSRDEFLYGNTSIEEQIEIAEVYAIAYGLD